MVQEHALPLLRAALVLEPVEQAPLRLRPDPGDRRQASGTRGFAELVGRRDAERAADLHHALGPDAEEAAKPDQLRLHVALELLQLRNPPGFDELVETPGDTRPDPPQLLDSAGRDELRDRRLRVADRLGRAAVCARRVMPGARQVEQARECFQLLGDLGICHTVSLAAWRRS